MKKKKVDRRAVGNEVGHLLSKHSEAEMELARAWDKHRELSQALQCDTGNRADTIQAIESIEDRIGSLQKLVSDLYEDILRLNKGRLSRV